MARLDGKVALISGGARGQGAVEARLFAREGAKVVIGDILDAEGKQVEAEINESERECLFVQLDVTSEANWRHAIEATVSRFGKLNVLVNNAGIGGERGPDGERLSVEDVTEEQWDLVMDVNAKGVFLGTKYAIPEMRKAGGGSIINISSIAGMVGGMTTAYAASAITLKAGFCVPIDGSTCPFCNGLNKRGGTSMLCPHCGPENPGRARFCNECATKLDSPADKHIFNILYKAGAANRTEAASYAHEHNLN